MIKRRYIIASILLLSYPIHLLAQNSNTVNIIITNKLDNSPVANVNVMVLGSTIGTSSSETGTCEISYNSLPFKLKFTHISFLSKIILVDSTNLSDTLRVLLEPESYNLKNVMVSAEKTPVFQQTEYSIIDFSVLNSQLVIIERSYTIKPKFRMVLASASFDIIHIYNLPDFIKPIKLFEGCLNNKYLITKDSAYQIVCYNNSISVNYPVEISKFHRIMDNCLFQKDSLLFFRKAMNNGYFYQFFSINLKTNKLVPLIVRNDNGRQIALKNDIKFIKKHPPKTPAEFVHIFDKQFLFYPIKPRLFCINDTIYYFDFKNNSYTTDVYSKNLTFIESYQMSIPKAFNILDKLFTDTQKNNVYLVANDLLYKINLTDGRMALKMKVNHAKKTLINDRYVFLLKEMTNFDRQKTFIERDELK